MQWITEHVFDAELLIYFDIKDILVEQNEKFLQREKPKGRDTSNLKHWVENQGSLARDERAYLWKDDLIALATVDAGDTQHSLEGLIEDFIIWTSRLAKRVRIFYSSLRDIIQYLLYNHV
jgi:hypothetical protein